MIQELPPRPESAAIIRDNANKYAQNVINNVDWLRNLSPKGATNAVLMIHAHADNNLLDQAIDNIFVYEDEVENQRAEGK